MKREIFIVLFLFSSHRGSKSGGTDDKQEITLSRRAKKDEKEKTQKDTPSAWGRGISISRNCQILLSPLDSFITLNRPKLRVFGLTKGALDLLCQENRSLRRLSRVFRCSIASARDPRRRRDPSRAVIGSRQRTTPAAGGILPTPSLL